MTQHFYIGVDGGATKCIVRVEDESGRLLGKEIGGPANIRMSVTHSWESIYSALNKILQAHAIELSDKRYVFHAGMGLAGCEIREAHQAFIQKPHPFASLVVSSDSHAACLGAHGGNDGAIIIAGTGVVGYQMMAGHETKVGGFGFPHDDEGGGAWMGLEAAKLTIKWLDGRAGITGLAKAVYAYFKEDGEQFLQWVNQANSTAFAVLAPIVIQQSQQEDAAAITILKRAANAIDIIGQTLRAKQRDQKQILPCSLVGGVTTYLEPYLQEELRARIRPLQASPDEGALMLVKRFLNKDRE